MPRFELLLTMEVGDVTVGALIKPEAFTRAAIIDAELDWDRGLAIGRIAMLWAKAQEGAGKSVAKRRLILEWACVDAADADRFLELCCMVKNSKDDPGDHIHFLEQRPDGCYYIVGNPEQIDKIEAFKRRASAGGIAKAEKERAAKAAIDSESASSTAPSSSSSDALCSASSTAASTAPSDALRVPSSLSYSLALTDPLSSSERPTRVGAGAHAYDPSPPEQDVRTGKKPGLSVNGLIALWNERIAAPLQTCPKLTSGRRKAANVALDAHPDPAYWAALIARLMCSPFAMGQVPSEVYPGGWVADIGYLIDRHEDIAAGVIDPRGRQRKNQPPNPKCFQCWDAGKIPVKAHEDGARYDFACSCPAGRRWDNELESWELELAHVADYELLRPWQKSNTETQL